MWYILAYTVHDELEMLNPEVDMGYREYMRLNIGIRADMKQKNLGTSWLSYVGVCTHM